MFRKYIKLFNLYLHKLLVSFKDSKIHFGKIKLQKYHKFGLITLIPLVILLVIFILPSNKVSGYEVTVNGKSIGVFDVSKERLSRYTSMLNISFADKKVPEAELLPENKLETVLTEQLTAKAQGFELKVKDYTGKRLILQTQDEVQKVLKAFQDKYTSKSKNKSEIIKEVKLLENYTIEPVYEQQPTISVNEALEIIKTGTDVKKVYALKSGDSISYVAQKFGMSIESITKANPNIMERETDLQIGEEINLIVPKPLLTVQVYKLATYKEKIPFKTKITPTKREYKTYWKVTTKGKEGIAKIKANIVEENGEIVSKLTEVLKRVVIRKPRTQRVLQGTLLVPPKRATGKFASPVYSVNISSRFGSRWNSFHYGIDIPKPIGTSVYASDGGVIAEINYNQYEGTGLMIRINHENGYQTKYLHLSQINVRVGERVYQGQKIGAVGNTGNSTGAHLHFEVLRNGVAINPLNVLFR